MRNLGFLAVVISMGFFSLAAPSRAGEPTLKVKAILDEAMDIQSQPDLMGEEHKELRFQAIKQIIAENFLIEEMASHALEGHWHDISASGRAEFQKIFSDLFQDSYTNMVLNFLQRETIEYSDEKASNGSIEVRTVIMRANEHIPVDYYLIRKSGIWLIEDVIIDGVSIVGNYQNAFHRVIVNESFEALLKKMRIHRKAVME